MSHTKQPLLRLVCPLLVSLAVSCTLNAPAQRRAGVLDYLYPAGSESQPPSDVRLELPLRVGIAFVPESYSSGSEGDSYDGWLGELGGSSTVAPLDSTEKQRLLERVAAAFRDEPGVAGIEIIPTSYLTAGGGFANVDQLRSLFGIELVALVSYDQVQVEDMSTSSWTYWTIVGAYVVEGNENATNTFVDTSVFDIPSRALLFNAGGRSQLTESSTAIESAQTLREQSRKGFEQSVEQMIGELHVALAAFREQAKSGNVRGAGTPALSVTGEGGADGKTGAGAAGPVELGCGLLLAAASLARGRKRSDERHQADG